VTTEALPRYTFFDPGSKFLGWATGDGRSLPQVGAFSFVQTGENYGKMLRQVADAVGEHLDTFRPAEVAYEEPVLIFNQRYKGKDGHWHKRNDNLATLRKTIPIGVRIEEICDRRGIPCRETSIESVKKELAGFGAATKDDMVAAAEKLGVALPDGPRAKDAADALGGWLLLLRYRNRVLSAEFDKRLWGSRRGALI
jgi:Holliday junction resolvasome RuvABC endonuclease subunit